jgi:MerR family transcriptional regulator, light-induced transcriptional regulator
MLQGLRAMIDLVDGIDAPSDARLRSGTAARLAGLPVTTLRVWERRYGVVSAPRSQTGQRLYSPHDVQRLRLLKQLTGRGHAIGTVAMLALETLQALMAEEPSAGPGSALPVALQAASPPSSPAALRAASTRDVDESPTAGGHGSVVAVGPGAALRLGSAAMPWALVVHEDLDEAQARAATAAAADVLWVHLPSVQPGAVEKVLALAATLRARSVIVTYAFAAGPLAAALSAAGVVLRRDPADGAELRRLINAALATPPASAAARQARRYSDEALIEMSEMPSTVACECPRHLAEIVMQLANFERYSAECGSSSPADAALHRHLCQLGGTARALFEEALARVVADEGIVLSHR